MSTKHIRTPADLARFRAGLRIDCRDYGASRTLDGFEAARLAGGVVRLAELARRLRCSRCGTKTAAVTILSPVDRR